MTFNSADPAGKRVLCRQRPRSKGGVAIGPGTFLRARRMGLCFFSGRRRAESHHRRQALHSFTGRTISNDDARIRSTRSAKLYERAEALCHSLNGPRLLYVALLGQWRYSLNTDTLSATMQLAKPVDSLAQEQNDTALMRGACHILATTVYFSGDFESARRYVMRGWAVRPTGGVHSPVEDIETPAASCRCLEAL